MLDEARRGTLPGMVRTGVTFADARPRSTCAGSSTTATRKPSTLRDYRSIIRAHLLPAFGEMRLEDITTDGVERWARRAGRRRAHEQPHEGQDPDRAARRDGARAKRVYRLPRNPVTDVEKPVQRRRTDIDVFSPEDVMALVRAADVRAGRRDLPDRRVHRPAPRRARRAALARRRLRRPARPRDRELHRGLADDAEVRQGPVGADGARRRRGARAARRSASSWTGEDDLVFPGIARRATSTPRRSTAATSSR